MSSYLIGNGALHTVSVSVCPWQCQCVGSHWIIIFISEINYYLVTVRFLSTTKYKQVKGMFQKSHPVCAVWVWFKYEIQLSHFIVNSSKINEIWRSSAGKSEDSDKWSDHVDWLTSQGVSSPPINVKFPPQAWPALFAPFTLNCCLSFNSNIQLFQCNNSAFISANILKENRKHIACGSKL